MSPPINKAADAVVLKHYKHMPVQEIALMLGVSAQAVYLRAHRLGVADPRPKSRKSAPSIVEAALAGRAPIEMVWHA